MKNMKKLLALCLCLMMVLSCIPAVSAATVEDATIDEAAKASLTIWKYDWTNAFKDGVWNEDSFISTGWRESYVEEVLGETVRAGDLNDDPDHPLGNGQNSNGYALKGVEFSILWVADIVTFTESANDQHPDYNLTQVLYGFDKTASADLLSAIGLANGAGRYANADNTDKLDSSKYYYVSDVLNKALADSLASNATTVKDALESYVISNPNTIVMDKTNENGKTIQRNLDLGLWLCVETATPEMITSSTNPFVISLPSTTVTGNEHSSSPEGGHFWNYDVVVYPKNNTGIPSLEKTIREAAADTGKNGGTDNIKDGFSHNATGSGGDVMEYQVISTLPTITSAATHLTTYNFYDSISAGLSYNKSRKDVKIEIFSDGSCNDKVASWDMNSGKFTVVYSSDDRHMTVDITQAGLDEINANTENAYGKLLRGYSNYTVRLTYTATVNSDDSVVYGENGNCNQVVLTWKRTNKDYYDTIIDDCHFYTFGIDLTKLFSDIDSQTAEETGLYKHVKFNLWNETDQYWLTAERDESTGIYYVTGHVTEESDATIFHPVTSSGEYGQIVVKGIEDDHIRLTEIETANGYTLLKDDIYVDILVEEDTDRLCDIYTKDMLGVLQNDPHYCYGGAEPSSLTDADGGDGLSLTGIPQRYLEHYLLTATATVDTNDVTMLEDNGSANAEVPLSVMNTRGFDLPKTGDNGVWMFGLIGVLLMSGSLVCIIVTSRKKRSSK